MMRRGRVFGESRPRGVAFVSFGIKQNNSNSVHGDCVVGQMKKAFSL
jgi:hypothetical protein